MSASLHTIGYGSRSLDDFLELLTRYRIEILVDVRSQPYSRFKPQFSKAPLQARVREQGVEYAWLGDVLGGRPDDPTCYTAGKVDYALCREKPLYQDGIGRLLRLCGDARGAVMCSEGRPQECHRSRLIGETLAGRGVDVLHIDEQGELRNHAEVIALLTGHQPDLFGAEYRHFMSRKALRET